MMGFPCLRRNGVFFASLEKATGDLIVKLPRPRVEALVHIKAGEPFAPAGRVFREWIRVSRAERSNWRMLIEEAYAFSGAG